MAAISGTIFPRCDIKESEKTPAWHSKFLDYAEAVLRNYSQDKQRMNRLFNVYNGIKDPLSIEWLTVIR